MMMLCYRDRSIPKDLNLIRLFYNSLKKFANIYNVYIQLILSEINMEQLKEMMKLSIKCKHFKIISNQSINHRYIFNILQKYLHCFKDAFYSNHNFNIFLKYLKHFISMQYGCGIRLSSIYHSFKVPDDRSSIWRPYFYSLVYTLLNGLVVFYLKKYFRWCEFNTVVPTVAYFTYESWKKLSTNFINDLIQNNIIQNKINHNSISLIYSNEYINKTYILTHSIGRLSMKPLRKDFRLVINANYQLLSSIKNLINPIEFNSNIQYSIESCLSLNQRLKLNNGLFEFLKKLKIELPGIYAPSLLSTKSAFNTLLSFRSLVYSIGFRRFWIAKLDILDFFNQINHSKLLDVFSDTLNEVSNYMYPTPNIHFLVRELEWFLKESIVSIDGKLYSFIKGIPQGSCISSDLANIYLAQLDRELHRTQTILWSPHKFLQNDIFKTTDIHLNKCSTILRYLDDYLCISTSKIELQNLIKRIKTSLNSYGLLLNEQKSQTNLYDPNVPIKWLGIEVHSSLTITLPKNNSPPKFCRFSGQSLSANDCMRRLCKFRLHCPTWRFTFHKIIYNTNIRQNVFICKNENIRKTNYLLQINANRLGNRIADIVWISLKTSPEKDRLLQPSTSRRLAKAIFRCICINIGFNRFWLYHLTVNSFIKRLLPHKGELKWLIIWMEQFNHLNNKKNIFLFYKNKEK